MCVMFELLSHERIVWLVELVTRREFENCPVMLSLSYRLKTLPRLFFNLSQMYLGTFYIRSELRIAKLPNFLSSCLIATSRKKTGELFALSCEP